MKTFMTILLLCFYHTMCAQEYLISDWRFHRGTAQGAQQISFDDSQWEKVLVPHDWAISGPFDKEIDKQTVAIVQNGEKEATEKTGRSGSLPWIGEGWYRTQIEIPEGYTHAELVFDGAMAEPRVYVNGIEVGYWAFGYNTFSVDITQALARDRSAIGNLIPGKATVAVHLQNLEESSRWYPGAGLYRPVRLVLGHEAGITTFGTFARTTRVDGISQDATQAENALLTVNTEVRSSNVIKWGDLRVVLTLKDSAGNQVARSSAALNDAHETSQVLNVKDVRLWSPENPVLYTLTTELQLAPKGADTRVMDIQTTTIGIRTIEYGQEGFRLNGQMRRFKGVCLHHDLGPLGAAFNKSAFRRQVRLLKEMGCDAIRTSHNMPAPWQMDICDQMGMMVMAESCDMWLYPKCKNGYARFFEEWWERDFTNLVRVHRNHPSIVMWSIGNEIPEQGNAKGLTYTRKIQNLIHGLDPTRPCTQGLDRGDAAIWSGVFQATDIPGFNYRVHLYEKGHANSPKGILLGSETASTVSSRGVYKFPVVESKNKSYDDGQCSSYDVEYCSWSNLPDDDWMWQDKAPWVIGEFVWTGFDYLGEPTPYDTYWPSRSSYFGIYDLAGLPKDRAWLYRIHWAPEKETLHLLPHWTWKGREGEVTPVFCYTSYPEAELFVNGKSQGRRKRLDLTLEEYRGKAPAVNRLDRYRLRWMDVCYEPGELKVVAYDANGNEVAQEVVRTAGKPHHIELIPDDSPLEIHQERKTTITMPSAGALDRRPLSFVTVRVVDKDGNLCPDADCQLSFSVKGSSARFNSCCNGDATSLEVFTNPTMKAFHGQLIVVVESTEATGSSLLTVTGKGLKSASLPINVSKSLAY